MKRRIVGLSCAAMTLCASVVRADPVRVSGGSLDYDSDFGGRIAILYLVADSVFNLHSLFVGIDPLPGAGGTPLLLNQTVAFNTRVTSFGPAFLGDQAQGELRFVSDPVTLPSVLPPSVFETTLAMPFTMSGGLETQTLVGTSRFSGDVLGSGILHATLRTTDPLSQPAQRFSLDSATFTFQAADVAPTPEPSTLILLTTGLGGAVMSSVGRRRRR